MGILILQTAIRNGSPGNNKQGAPFGAARGMRPAGAGSRCPTRAMAGLAGVNPGWMENVSLL